MISFREFVRALEEEGVAVNNAGGGAVAGIGIGSSGEPGVKKKKKRGLLTRGELRGEKRQS